MMAEPAFPLPKPDDESEARLAVMLELLARNRFLPAPPAETVFVGDGDYRSIGREFLGHFVRLGGLRPTDRVLDIGCGIGRMAVPLTQFLDAEKGSYDGIDPVHEGIAWCRENVTPLYPNFRFSRLNISHPVYNPEGRIPGKEIRLPYADRVFNFVAMVSVVTHLPPAEVANYLREAARVLAEGGRLFMTAFLVAPSDVQHPKARPQFVRGKKGPVWYGDPEVPLAAVGYDCGILERVLKRLGFRLETTSLGHWRGTAGEHYQDIIVATRTRRAR